MAEYASNRFTLVCTIAATLPTTMETTASTASTGIQPGRRSARRRCSAHRANAVNRIRASTKKLATLEPEAMNEATGVGAP